MNVQNEIYFPRLEMQIDVGHNSDWNRFRADITLVFEASHQELHQLVDGAGVSNRLDLLFRPSRFVVILLNLLRMVVKVVGYHVSGFYQTQFY